MSEAPDSVRRVESSETATPSAAQSATQSAAQSAAGPALPLAAVAGTLLLWSSAFVAIRHLGPAFSPGSLSLGRLLVGVVALGGVLATRGWVRPSGRDWLRLLAIGLLW